ncbi:MAG TPA: cytochrome c [Longimicrobiales bacterium]|nr:cytochrome c [Longimicrobiales bacterium]
MINGSRFVLLTAAILLAGCEGAAPETAPPPDAGAAEHPDTASRVGTADTSHAVAADTGVHEEMALLPIMRHLAEDMAAMQSALWLEDFATVEQHASAIADHAHMSAEEVARIRTELGAEMPQFESADAAVHEAAVQMHEAARERDTDAVLDRLADVQRGCVACHERFRERLRTTQ